MEVCPDQFINKYKIRFFSTVILTAILQNLTKSINEGFFFQILNKKDLLDWISFIFNFLELFKIIIIILSTIQNKCSKVNV